MPAPECPNIDCASARRWAQLSPFLSVFAARVHYVGDQFYGGVLVREWQCSGCGKG